MASAGKGVRLLWAVSFCLLSASPCFAEPLPIVVTLPVLKDFAEEIGGEHVTVKSLISGLESEHVYTPKPSDVMAVRKAKLLLKVGLGLEVWVDSLIRNADREDLAVVTTSEGVPLIENGDAHEDAHGPPHANPHIWLDPENAKIMIRPITEHLIRLDPAHQEDYLQNQSSYIVALEKLTADLSNRVAVLRDRSIITHHPAWPYFARRFGFMIRGNIMQAGSEPSARQMGALIRKIRSEKIKVIVSEPQLSAKIPKMLSEETGARVITLSPLPGAISGTDHYLDFIRHNVETLISALRGT